MYILRTALNRFKSNGHFAPFHSRNVQGVCVKFQRLRSGRDHQVSLVLYSNLRFCEKIILVYVTCPWVALCPRKYPRPIRALPFSGPSECFPSDCFDYSSIDRLSLWPSYFRADNLLLYVCYINSWFVLVWFTSCCWTGRRIAHDTYPQGGLDVRCTDGCFTTSPGGRLGSTSRWSINRWCICPNCETLLVYPLLLVTSTLSNLSLSMAILYQVPGRVWRNARRWAPCLCPNL